MTKKVRKVLKSRIKYNNGGYFETGYIYHSPHSCNTVYLRVKKVGETAAWDFHLTDDEAMGMIKVLSDVVWERLDKCIKRQRK